MTTDIATRETTELALPSPVFRGKQMVQALADYRELQRALDESMPDQLMELDGKKFRKKGYWRAISVAFNLTVEPIDERRDVNGTFEDGRDNFGYIVTYRATSGVRSVTGDGSCFAVEKARRFKCPHPEREGSKRTLHFPHSTCPDFDPHFQWRTLPGEATEHNIRSHAHTRSMNRAISNLVGFGEVSAEEVERDEHTTTARQVDPETGEVRDTPKRADGSALVVSVTEKSGTNKQGKPWTSYTVTLDDGRSGSTFDKAMALRARTAQAEKVLVATTWEVKGNFTNLTGLEKAPEAPDPNGQADARISDADRTALLKIANTHKWGTEQLQELLASHGFEQTFEVTNAKYNGILNALKSGPPKDDEPTGDSTGVK